MTVYKCDINETKKYSSIKGILDFFIESVSICFLILYIYTINSTVLKLDDVRKRNKCFGC